MLDAAIINLSILNELPQPHTSSLLLVILSNAKNLLS